MVSKDSFQQWRDEKFENLQHQTNAKLKVVIVGGGPVGGAAAVVFRKKGYVVDIYERYDPNKADQNSSRSINLVLTRRGLRIAEELGYR